MEPDVVDQHHAERDREQVEERVVPGQRDQDLERDEKRKRELLAPPGQEHEERNHELDEEEHHARDAVERERQLVKGPSDPRGERLCLIVIAECGQ